MKKILTAAALSFACIGLAGAPAFAAKAKPAKVEKKCDKDGKECKDGDECKAANCKPAEAKPAPAPAPAPAPTPAPAPAPAK